MSKKPTYVLKSVPNELWIDSNETKELCAAKLNSELS